MPARKKRRVLQHIMEDGSYAIIKDALPKGWVIRDFNKPDYGIDLVIELFEEIKEEDLEEVYETLGEFLYVQVKSVNKIKRSKDKVYPVQNVAKSGWLEDRSEFKEIDLAKFEIDTNSIYSIQSMGNSVAVLLFLVELSTNKVYFICLNDYIDKVLLPQKPNYANQENITISIPILNDLKDQHIGISAMKFYGKRSKLLAAFSRFMYQHKEIYSMLHRHNILINIDNKELESKLNPEVLDKVKIQIAFYIQQIENLEIWNTTSWSPLKSSIQEIQKVKTELDRQTDTKMLIDLIIETWRRLINLNNMYEELTREWFMPKYLSLLTSYPEQNKKSNEA